MPLKDLGLIVEPNFPNAAGLMAIGAAQAEETAGPDMVYRNCFYSSRWRCDIYVWSEGGRVLSGKVPRVHGMGFMLHTLGATFAWGIEQEHNALKLLGSLIPHHAFKQYLLCGMFMETSKRSGLTYVFRKLRPTVVIDIRPNQITYDFGDLSARRHGVKKSRILCCLCMHPIAYYDQSWAGAMTPTDDVVAHLMLMRGDEPMFWRRCNQHNPAMPEAGL